MSSWMVRTNEIWIPKEEDIITYWRVVFIDLDQVTLQNVDDLGEHIIICLEEFEKYWIPYNDRVN